MFKFPVVMPKKCTTTLVLKAPKTESSNRTVYLPVVLSMSCNGFRSVRKSIKRFWVMSTGTMDWSLHDSMDASMSSE